MFVPTAATCPCSSFYELRDRPIFLAELPDAGLEVVNGADGISDIEGKVARVATSKLGNERVSMQWMERKTSHVVLARACHKRAQHGHRQGEHGDTSAQGSQRGSFFSEEHLDLVEDDSVRCR
jgi:hypothetical protein